MSSTAKHNVSYYFLLSILLIGAIVILYAGVYGVWTLYNNHLFNTRGYDTTATIIKKDNGRVQYDIEYDGVYYRNWVSLSKKAFRDTEVGQRFRAVILPDMLQHDHEFGITPRYIKIILSPLPEYEQNYAEELVRIQEMYDAQTVFSNIQKELLPGPLPIGRPYQEISLELEENNFIPLKLYTNFQLTEWIDASYGDVSSPVVNMYIRIPSTNYCLFSVRVGGITEYATLYLVLTDLNGNVLDLLEAEVFWFEAYAKEARIDQNYNITVYSIHTQATASLHVDASMPSFLGWREDINYRIINGKFTKTDTTTYKTRTFRLSDLSNNLWDGPDIPLLQKPTPPRQPNKKRKRDT